jgi:hypothetical protein
MEFKLLLASKLYTLHYEYEKIVKVDSLNDLEKIYNEYHKNELIIDFETMKITIYDYYLE